MRAIITFFILLSLSIWVQAQECSIDIHVSDSTCCVISDLLNRKTGVDSKFIINPKEWKKFREISRSFCSFQNLEDLGDTSKATHWFEVGFTSPITEKEYIYTVNVIGYRSNTYSLSIETGLSTSPPQWLHYYKLNVPIERDSVVTYKLHLRTSSGVLVSQIIKEVNVASLIQDIVVMSKIGWLKTEETANSYIMLFQTLKMQYDAQNYESVRATLNTINQSLVADSTSAITIDAYKSLRSDTDQLLAQLPTAPMTGCNIKLINSTGVKLTGGALQYYDGSWKDAVNNNDGTFFVNTAKTTLSLRMTYEYGTQTKSNVAVGSDTIAFQTVNAQIQLQNSNGVLIDTGSVQYYASAWRGLGTTINGIAAKEMLPANYSFRMTYAYASKDKQQDISTNSVVVFQTVNSNVQLQNSQGTLIDQGTVQYYSGAWRSLGATVNGVATKELLPNNYSFRMTYEYASKDKQQNLSANPTVVFQTVNAAVQLKNSQGNLIDQGIVQYYSGAWRAFGTTNNGTTNKELLPNNYSFRMTYEYASKDKQQDLSANPTVVFQTVNATVQLQNSQGALIDQGTVQYYSGAWRAFGTTNNGTTNKELLPNNYSFRMTYEYANKDKQQDLSTNPTVVFQTVNAAVQLQNSQSTLIPAPSGDQGTVQYYSGAWRAFDTTTNGVANKELLPNNYSFRMTYEYANKDKQQDLSTNPTVVFQTVNAQVQLKNSQGTLIDQGTVQYYSGAWRNLGITTNGTASKELLPNNYSFRMTYEYASIDKQQDITTNNIVGFSTVLCTIRAKNSQNELIDGATASYYSGTWRVIGLTVNGEITKELLPLNLSFRVKYGTKQNDKQQNLSTNNIVELVIP